MKKELSGTLLLPLTLIILGTTLVVDHLTGTNLAARLWAFWPLLPLALGVEILLRIYLAHRRGRTVLVRPARSALLLTALVMGLALASTAVTAVVSELGGLGAMDLADPASWVNLVQRLAGGMEANLGGVVQRQEFHRVEAAAGLDSLSLSNINGRVRIVAGSEDAVKIDAIIEGRGFNEAEARQNAEGVKISVNRVGKKLEIKVVDPNGQDWGGFDSWRDGPSPAQWLESFGRIPLGKKSTPLSRSVVNYEITVPSRFALNVAAVAGEILVDGINSKINLATVSATVRVQNTSGPLNVATISGKIELEKTGGEIHGKTVSGKITVMGGKGDVTLTTTSGPIFLQKVEGSQVSATSLSGNIQVDDVRGQLNLQTASGSLDIASSPGPVTAKTLSGGVTVDLPASARRIFVRSTSGGINLALPADISARLWARTSSGSLHVSGELPLAVSRSGTATVAEGTLGRGEALIDLQTSSGGITISERRR